MFELVNDQLGEFYFRARRYPRQENGRFGEWCAWCARTPNLGTCVMDVDFAVDCWFDYGATAADAISKLKLEVLN